MNNYKELLFLKELNGVGPARINRFYVPKLSKNMDIVALITIVKENESKVDDSNIDSALQKADLLYDTYSKRDDMRIITILDDEYPSKLKSLENNAPVILYARGDISIAEKPSLSVIGTRTPGEWSSKVEQQMVGKVIELSDRVIVSGLAQGCDTIAHRTCLEKGGLTIAVLPCGFDHIFPEENEGLCNEIVAKGGLLISEYPPEVEATRYTFVNRDTLIAALSDAVFVMECGADSGTMHTVKDAIRLNRKAAAFSTDTMDKGIYDGNGKIISEMNGIPVSDTDSLKAFLDDIGTVAVEEQPTQMSLFDFMGDR